MVRRLREKGTRQRVPALVNMHNPGLTSGVENQPDAGRLGRPPHPFVSEVRSLRARSFAEYSELTGREYTPILTYMCDDAETVMIGLGSVTDDARAVASYLRGQGKRSARSLSSCCSRSRKPRWSRRWQARRR